MSTVLLSKTEEISQPTIPSGIGIPPQPKLLYEIERVYPDIDQVAALIMAEPKVASGLLKVVNSPCIGLSRDVTRIEQAVILLGLDSIMNLINSVLLQDTFQQQLKEELLKGYWKNSMQTAFACALLARRCLGVRPDDAYVLGLFHNCAIPLIFETHQNYFEIARLSYSDTAARITQVEEKKLGVDHAGIGYYISRAWNLPLSIITAIRDHHDHQRLRCESRDEVGRHIDQLCALLKTAEHMCHTYCVLGMQAKDHEWEVFKGSILKKLNIEEKKLGSITDSIMEEVHGNHCLFL